MSLLGVWLQMLNVIICCTVIPASPRLMICVCVCLCVCVAHFLLVRHLRYLPKQIHCTEVCLKNKTQVHGHEQIFS